MTSAATSSRRRSVLAGVAAVALVGLATACEPDADAQPPVASVDFAPRLVVVVDDASIVAEPGERGGAEAAGEAVVDWVLPAGSVVELRNQADEAREVEITTAPLGSTDDDADRVWLDTGSMEPGDTVVLGLSAPADYTFSAPATGTADAHELSIRVVPRADT